MRTFFEDRIMPITDEMRRAAALHLAITITQADREDIDPVDPMWLLAVAEQVVLYLKGERPQSVS
jgi:hypothetical protein